MEQEGLEWLTSGLGSTYFGSKWYRGYRCVGNEVLEEERNARQCRGFDMSYGVDGFVFINVEMWWEVRNFS